MEATNQRAGGRGQLAGRVRREAGFCRFCWEARRMEAGTGRRSETQTLTVNDALRLTAYALRLEISADLSRARNHTLLETE